MVTHLHQRKAQWVWCHPQTSGAWRTDDWRCSCWCTGKRVEEKGCSLGEIQCWSPASHTASHQTESLWPTCRWSQAHSAGRAYPAAEPGWLYWKQSWSPQTESWHRFLRSQSAGGWSGGHRLQTYWLGRLNAGDPGVGVWWPQGGTAQGAQMTSLPQRSGWWVCNHEVLWTLLQYTNISLGDCWNISAEMITSL